MNHSIEEVHETIEICLRRTATSILERTSSSDRIIVELESLALYLEESQYAETLNIVRSLIREAVESLEEHVIIRRGRPPIVINISSVENLLSMNFRLRFIAKFMGVNVRTLHRRLKDAEISVRATYYTISDPDLDALIEEILLQYPNTGYKRMIGFLLSRNVKVTQYKVRESMRRVDPEGVYQRKLQNRAIVRRVYYVPYSNALWHIDTNLKLERWKIVIRGGIDGKSRNCVYLEAGNNNRADSNFLAFMKAVERYGIPYRCRSDKGGENRLVAEFMLFQRGLGRSSHICGRSVHNQRIERFWRDLGYGLISFYRQVFLWMEHTRILDVEVGAHMFALHFVFLPRINQQLEDFMNGWNNHPLSTENNKTPQQLMLIHMPPRNYDMIMSEEGEELADFLVNQEVDLERFEDGINNFNTHYPVPRDHAEERLRNIDPPARSNSYGEDIFLQVVEALNHRDDHVPEISALPVIQ